MQFVRGQKVKVVDLVPAQKLVIGTKVHINGAVEMDMTCFGVDEQDRLRDERYFVFYNQTSSPEGAIRQIECVEGERGRFSIDVTQLPDTIKKVVITLAIDGECVMKDIVQGELALYGGSEKLGTFTFSGEGFDSEKALIMVELYEKSGVWRMNFVGRGFDGGLSALLAHYGGLESEEVVQAEGEMERDEIGNRENPIEEVTELVEINEKKCIRGDQDQQADEKTTLASSATGWSQIQSFIDNRMPSLLPLVERVRKVLEEKRLLDQAFRVAVALDCSRSTEQLYETGEIQGMLTYTLPIALAKGQLEGLEVWAFADRCKQLPLLSLENIDTYLREVEEGWSNWSVGTYNNEVGAMEAIITHYKESNLPVFVLFVSNGEINVNATLKVLIKKAAKYPIFWQFVGLGGSAYGVLEEQENFFALEALAGISDEVFYEKVLAYLSEIRSERLII